MVYLNTIVSRVLVLVFLFSCSAEASIYGMPDPGFGINEQPTSVDCYVNKFTVGATDTANPCGTLLIPRLTIPTVSLPPDTIIRVTGGAGTYAANFAINSAGSLAQPVFIVGYDDGHGLPIFYGNGIGDIIDLNGTYLILLNLYVVGARLDFQGVAIASRDVSVFATQSVGCVAFFGTSNVFYHGNIFDCGDDVSPTENDFHGVYVSQGALFSWVLNSSIHNNGGDAIQVGNQSCDTTSGPLARYTFIGGNTFHDDRENAVDIKCVLDTVVSTNVAYGYEYSTSSEGAAIVVHDDGQRTWIFNNFLYNNRTGITSTGCTGIVLYGNVLVGLGIATGDPSLYGPGGILITNTVNIGLYYNTLYNWNSSISTPSGISGSNEISGNIVNTTTYDYRLPSGTWPSSFNIAPPTNPVFLSPLTLNYRLQDTSPALNAGGNAPTFLATYTSLYNASLTVDVYGATRSNPYSIGASQLGVEAPSSTHPVRLRFGD